MAPDASLFEYALAGLLTSLLAGWISRGLHGPRKKPQPFVPFHHRSEFGNDDPKPPPEPEILPPHEPLTRQELSKIAAALPMWPSFPDGGLGNRRGNRGPLGGEDAGQSGWPRTTDGRSLLCGPRPTGRHEMR